MTAYVDYRLRAPTEDAAKQAASAALPSGFELVRLAEDGETWEWVTASLRHAFDPGCPGPIVAIETADVPDVGEIDVPIHDAAHWYANLRVVPDLASAVDGLLAAVGEPLGVEITPVTGREWA